MALVRDSIFPQAQLLLDGLMRKKLSGPGKWTISHKHVLFVCFFLSLSAALTDLIKKPLPTLAHLAFSMPCGHCLHFYHYFAKNTTATVLWWTTKQCLAIWISQLGLCKQVQEGKHLPVLGVFQTVLVKKPFAQEVGCCFFSRLSLTSEIGSTSLCLTWKWILENMLLGAV